MKALRSMILLVSLLASLLAVVAASAAPGSRDRDKSTTAAAKAAPATRVSTPAPSHAPSRPGATSSSGRSGGGSASTAKSYTTASSASWSSTQSRGSGRGTSSTPNPAPAQPKAPAPTFSSAKGSWGSGNNSQSGHAATGTTVRPVAGSGSALAAHGNGWNGSFAGNGEHVSGNASGHPGQVVSAQPAPRGNDGGLRGSNDRDSRVNVVDRGRGDGNNWNDRGGFRIRFTPRPDFHRPSDWDRPYHGRFEVVWQYFLPTIRVARYEAPVSLPPLGSVIVGTGDTFLGVISMDRNAPDSIANPYGRFGSPESPDSIWNGSGQWGAGNSPLSPWAPSAAEPPAIYVGNTFWGYLTVNDGVYPRVSPSWLADRLGIPLA